jgi:hypothetical protein
LTGGGGGRGAAEADADGAVAGSSSYNSSGALVAGAGDVAVVVDAEGVGAVALVGADAVDGGSGPKGEGVTVGCCAKAIQGATIVATAITETAKHFMRLPLQSARGEIR